MTNIAMTEVLKNDIVQLNFSKQYLKQASPFLCIYNIKYI